MYPSHSILSDPAVSNITGNVTVGCAPIDANGFHQIEWMMRYFGTCARSPMEQASFYVGLASIGFWLCANTPQLIETYRKKDARSLAPVFLLLWITGDATNLIGAVLTGQLFTQIAVAIYFFVMDVLLITQYSYYELRRKFNERSSAYNSSLNVRSVSAPPETPLVVRPPTQLNSYLFLTFLLCMGGVLFITNINVASSDSSIRLPGRTLLSTNEVIIIDDDPWPLESAVEKIGYSLGSLSAALYLASRIPQILKNFYRKSTEGLSPILFLCAFLGNTAYTLSVLLYSVDLNFILSKLPWIVGSAGVLLLDLVILSQFVLFRKNIQKTPGFEELAEDEVEKTV
ncbi:lysosomal amino acid transporter [Acrasis kona]|uniref:Lysosomal amino acid transporter n=1 Tax=Acrasis kona TaxID=1008807 RepID=A0AAW2ZFE1_9EUKA